MSEPTLRFSVIVPTRDRPLALKRCLESLLVLDYPVDAWELIVVNDGGSEPFSQLPDGLTSRLPLRAHSIHHRGAAGARNAGAGLAGGDILAFLDDDCQASPDWLRAYAAGFAEGGWSALGGRSVNPDPENLAMECWHTVIDFLYAHLVDASGNSLLLVSNNAAFRRRAFEQVGGFDEAFQWTEDWDLSARLLLEGLRLGHWPSATVRHHLLDATAWGYVKQQFNYGRGAARLERKLIASGLDGWIDRLMRGRGSFRRELRRTLSARRSPLRIWLLIYLSQLGYRLGKLAGRVRRDSGRPLMSD